MPDLRNGLIFTPDNALDIGASGATRPRNLFLAGSITSAGGIVVGSTTVTVITTSGAIGTQTNADLLLLSNNIIRWRITNAGTLSAEVDNTYDIGVSGANRPRDLFLARNATIDGSIGQGIAPQATTGLYLNLSTLSGASVWGLRSTPTAAIGVSNIRALLGKAQAAASAVLAEAICVFVDSPGLGASATITTTRGLYVVNQGATGVTNAYGVYINPQSGASATNIGLYNGGTSQLVGDVTFGGNLLGSDVPRANLLTNGGFEIWQRGNGPFTAAGAFTADRWQINLGAGSSLSVSRDGTNNDVASVYCAACTYTHSNVSALEQKLEYFAGLRGKQVAFSARVRTSTASAIRLRITTSGTGAATTDGSFHSGGGTYETLSVTATIGASISAVVVSVVASASCTFYVDAAMFVIGSAAVTYLPLHPADDLARCQRYYEVMGGVADEVLAIGQATGTTVAYFPIRFKVRKAITPTMTVGASGDALRVTAASGGPIGGASQTFSNTTVDGTKLIHTCATASLVAGNATLLYPTSSSGTVIAEANP
jgi:hypothetical protein